MANPLDAFKKTPVSNDVRIPEMPKALEFVKEGGLMLGLQKFDEEMMRWRLDFERILNERFSQQAEKTDVTTS